ncbi:MAG: ABC transporter substrate-binding protein ['Conium maculatum' witches'-broom phytoplasma]|nr:ABC transporter substrate-binding protein ['Conium maculatum' witches'-broom phytoplasma]
MLEPKGYKTKEYVKLKQFKNYHKKDDLTNSYENIIFKISPDYDTNLLELEKGEIHAILNYPMPNIKRDKLEDESQNKLKNIKVLNAGNSYTSYIYINEDKTDEKMRTVIREALDIEKIVKNLRWEKAEFSPTKETQNLEKTQNYLNENPDKKKIKIVYFSHKKIFYEFIQ